MLKSIAQEVEERTQEYWHLSSVWNGRASDYITVEDAINRANRLADEINPLRPVVKYGNRLLADFIQGQGTEREQPAKLLEFPTVDIVASN